MDERGHRRDLGSVSVGIFPLLRQLYVIGTRGRLVLGGRVFLICSGALTQNSAF